MGWERRLALAVLLVHLALSPLLFSPVSADVFEYPKVMLLRVAAILLMGIGVSGLAGRVLRAGWRFSLGRDPIAWGVLAFLASAAISTGFSLSPRISLIGAHESFSGLLHLLGWAVLFFATRAAVTGPGDVRRILWTMLAASVAACAYALIQLAGVDPLAWARTAAFRGHTRPFGTLGHPILLAGFLVTVFPVCAYLALNAWRRGRLIGAGVAVGAVLLGWAVTFASLSRGAWLALGLALSTLLLGWWRVGERSGARVLLGGAGALVGLALAGVWILALIDDTSALREVVLVRAGSVFHLGQEPRLQIWHAAWQMFVEQPISGVGVDAFQLAFQRFRAAAYWQVEWGGTPTRAHNEVLHVAATQGALGLAALALLVGGLARGWRRALRGARSLDDQGLLVAVGAGLIAFAAQSLFSFTVASTGTLFVTYAALVSRLAPGFPEQGRANAAGRRGRLLPLRLTRVAVLSGVLVLLNYAVYNPLRANTAFQSGRVLTLRGEHDAAIAQLTRALALDGERQTYWLALSAAHHAAGTREPAVHEKRAHFELARRAVTRAIELVPLDGYGHANLGLTLLALATLDPPAAGPEEVIQAFDRAVVLDGRNAHFLSEAAQAALTLGELEHAESYAGRNRKYYPAYALARLQLGEVALRRADWEAAAVEFEAALEGNWRGAKGLVAVWRGLAHARLELAQPAEALRAAQEAVTLASEDALAWRRRGQAQEALALRAGESAEQLLRDAIDSYGRAFLLDPGDTFARSALGRLLPN